MDYKPPKCGMHIRVVPHPGCQPKAPTGSLAIIKLPPNASNS